MFGRRGGVRVLQNLEPQSRVTETPILPCCISRASKLIKVAGIVKKSRGDDKGNKMK